MMGQSGASDRRTYTELLDAGCTCEFGCPRCGYEVSQMGNCPAFNPCPVGREHHDDCPVHGDPDA